MEELLLTGLGSFIPSSPDGRCCKCRACRGRPRGCASPIHLCPLLPSILAILPKPFFLSHTPRKLLNLEANSLPGALHPPPFEFPCSSRRPLFAPWCQQVLPTLKNISKIPVRSQGGLFPTVASSLSPCPTLEPGQPGQAALPLGRGSTLLARNFVFLSANRNKYPQK